MIQAFEEWRQEVVGTQNPVSVIINHKPLEYFMKSHLLSREQACHSDSYHDFISKSHIVHVTKMALLTIFTALLTIPYQEINFQNNL